MKNSDNKFEAADRLTEEVSAYVGHLESGDCSYPNGIELKGPVGGAFDSISEAVALSREDGFPNIDGVAIVDDSKKAELDEIPKTVTWILLENSKWMDKFAIKSGIYDVIPESYVVIDDRYNTSVNWVCLVYNNGRPIAIQQCHYLMGKPSNENPFPLNSCIVGIKVFPIDDCEYAIIDHQATLISDDNNSPYQSSAMFFDPNLGYYLSALSQFALPVTKLANHIKSQIRLRRSLLRLGRNYSV